MQVEQTTQKMSFIKNFKQIIVQFQCFFFVPQVLQCINHSEKKFIFEISAHCICKQLVRIHLFAKWLSSSFDRFV